MKSVKEVLEELRIPHLESGHHHTRSGWIQIDCPWCSPQSGAYRMGINTNFKYCNCWVCGSHGLIKTLMEVSNESYKSVYKCVGEIQEGVIRRQHHKGKFNPPKGVGSLLPAHKKYLKGRGFGVPLIKLWGLKGIGIAPKLQWRIFIPIVYQGHPVSWTTRSIVNTGVRYISASPEEESINHKTLLYGEDYCRHTIIVVEGPIDAWTIGPGCVATFGTSYHRTQVARISKYPRRVICFDNEKTAQERARKLCDEVETFPGKTYNVVLSGKDANSSDPKEILELRKRFLT